MSDQELFKTADFPNIEACDPRQCINGRIARIQRMVSDIFRQELKPHGISSSQLSILFVLAKKGPIQQKLISEILVLEKSSLSRNLTRLFRKKYLMKLDTGLLDITESGKMHLENIIPAWQRAMTSARQKLGTTGEDALQLVLNQMSNS